MGALEDAVMDILWEDGGWLVPSAVHARLPAERDLSYTTVMTTLARLQKKGSAQARAGLRLPSPSDPRRVGCRSNERDVQHHK